MTGTEHQAPRLDAIDHLHVHVGNRAAAETWYARILGLQRVPELAHWARDGGPLTLSDRAHALHLALFERPVPVSGHAPIALRVTAEGLRAWQAHLARELGSAPPLEDHGESASIYFRDPDGNAFEITHYEVADNSATLEALLTEELAYAVEYGATTAGDALSSHLPMALHALAALGAPPLRLRAWAARHFAAADLAPAWPELAQRETEILAALQRDGADAVLALRLPTLLAHAGAVAFHAMIRTAHAWESGHLGQLARALAYWSLRDMPLPASPATSAPPLDLASWTQALLALPRMGTDRPLIQQRMCCAAERPDFQAVAPRLRLAGDPWAQLRQLGHWAAQAYTDSGNFTLLHALTGSRALTRLLPLLPAPQHAAVVRGFGWQLAAALVASRWTGECRPHVPAADWDTLRQTAIAHEDEHAIKAVHAAWDLGQLVPHDPDPVWRQAAARALASFR